MKHLPKLYENIVSVKLVIIVSIVYKRFSSTYCSLQGSCIKLIISMRTSLML